MAENRLLQNEFLENCKKQNIDRVLAEKVFAYLMEHQYLSQGSRHGTQVELKRILEKVLEDN